MSRRGKLALLRNVRLEAVVDESKDPCGSILRERKALLALLDRTFEWRRITEGIANVAPRK
jgi:hypothetical protein